MIIKSERMEDHARDIAETFDVLDKEAKLGQMYIETKSSKIPHFHDIRMRDRGESLKNLSNHRHVTSEQYKGSTTIEWVNYSSRQIHELLS